tara:strand:+ start:857 stop:1114 length:258 start_codon:yes stop_codon:yes gene_type:complete
MSRSILEKIIETYPDETFLYPTGFEDCVVGVERDRGTLVMDANKIIDKLMYEDDMDVLDAQEHFDYNIAGSKGEGFPIYIYIPTE